MNIALILSGGTGTRLGADIPKQYIEVNGKAIISYCLETLFVHPGIDGVQIVADPAWQQEILKEIEAVLPVLEQEKTGELTDTREQDRMDKAGTYGNVSTYGGDRVTGGQDSEIKNLLYQKFRGFSTPGATRQLSILNGLEDICAYASETDIVMIHDAARPCLTAELVSECLEAMKGHDGVLPVLPMKDTVYMSEDGKAVSSLLNRSQVFAGQAPEFFVLGKYYEANRRLLPDKILEINGSTEPAILAGMDIAMVPGDEGNFKVTTKTDLERFAQIVSNREADA